MTKVVDASVLIRAWLPTQYLPQAEELLATPDAIAAPMVLRQEVDNALHVVQRRGLLIESDVDEILARFEQLAIVFSDHQLWIPRALGTARSYRQPTIFDAIYLACAEDLGAELWTCDRRFAASFGPERPARLKLCPDDFGLA